MLCSCGIHGKISILVFAHHVLISSVTNFYLIGKLELNVLFDNILKPSAINILAGGLCYVEENQIVSWYQDLYMSKAINNQKTKDISSSSYQL